MLSFKCVQVLEAGNMLAEVRFEVFLNGEPTKQFVELRLQPDFCAIGDFYNLTASDYRFPNSKVAIEKFGTA